MSQLFESGPASWPPMPQGCVGKPSTSMCRVSHHSLYDDFVDNTSVLARDEPQLTTLSIFEYAIPHAIREQLIRRVISVHELDHLLVRHA